MHLVAAPKQPVYVGQAAPTGVDADQSASAFGSVQVQGRFGGLHQRTQGPGQLNSPAKELVHYYLLVAACQHSPQLPSPPIALADEKPLCCKRCRPSTR